MKKPAAGKLFTTLRDAASRRSPEILTGIGIAGMITTTVLAVRATPKALSLIEEERENSFPLDEDIKLTPVEVVKTTWKCYIPATVTCALSISCLIGASRVNLKRNAVLATAYKLSEKALSEYKDAVIETIGEKKEQVVRDKVAQERLKNEPVSKSEVIVTSHGSTLCHDAIGRYFESDMETIKRAQNNLNKQMLNEMYVSLNDFYDELDLTHTSLGDELGWKLDDGLIEIGFSSQIAEDGRPCLVLDYRVAPKYGYYKMA